jgi:hypothetical protein
VAATPDTPAIGALASAVPRWSRPATGAVLTAATGAALHLALAWVYLNLIVRAFSGQVIAERAFGVPGLAALAITIVASAVTGAYCSARSGAGGLVFALQLTFLIIPLQALTSVGFYYALPEFSSVVGLAYVLAVVIAAWLPRMRVARPRRSTALIIIGLMMLAGLYLYVALIAGGGLQRLNFDLTKVYDVRAEFLEEALPPFGGYLVPWFGYVLNPALCLVGVRRRAWTWMALSVAMQALLFGSTGFRAFLFLPLLIAGCAWLGSRRYLPTMLMLGVGAVISLALLLYAITDSPLIPALGVYRLLLVPAEVHFWYYDYFATQGHDLLMLTQSVFASLGHSAQQPIAETVGRAYGGGLMSANVGLFGDAYANFGVAGCFAYAVLTALLVSALDALSRDLPRWLAAGLIGAPALQLVNSGLLTTMATHGFALLLLVLWLLQPLSRPRAVGRAGV